MNKYVKSFLQRGLAFGGLGPVIAGIVYAILEYTLPNFTLSGTQVCLAIFTTYLLAFAQAGASVFNQMEEWSVPRSMLCHFSVIYVAYMLCYLVNSWIPFEWAVVLIFTAIFVVTYLVIWLAVYLVTKSVGKRLNKKLS